VFVNAVRAPALAGVRVTAAELKRGLTAAGLPADKALIRGLADEAADHARRLQLEDRLRAELAELGRPLRELPFLPDGVDLGGLYTLADALCEQGVKAP
jgi:hypothetical protein